MFTVPVCTSPGVSAEFLDIFPRKPTGWQLYFDKKCCFLLWPAESVAVVWGGGQGGEHPPLHPPVLLPLGESLSHSHPDSSLPQHSHVFQSKRDAPDRILYYLLPLFCCKSHTARVKTSYLDCRRFTGASQPTSNRLLCLRWTHEELSYSDTYIFKLSCY